MRNENFKIWSILSFFQNIKFEAGGGKRVKAREGGKEGGAAAQAPPPAPVPVPEGSQGGDGQCECQGGPERLNGSNYEVVANNFRIKKSNKYSFFS